MELPVEARIRSAVFLILFRFEHGLRACRLFLDPFFFKPDAFCAGPDSRCPKFLNRYPFCCTHNTRDSPCVQVYDCFFGLAKGGADSAEM
ncbi:hypothetical protein DL89DRAFT_170974 [Linderina pennispora]|uniref:Uncharacterized protein n=1 Tax=Linderina pennispora TaxID=61395 RepID=A0A1Y1W6T1_9FUNG|nr:uncharacterized protein DL89DRAFT_170974 [Linderina pennispora]ORX69085.1 hypothetical protein DL89DRAFT_170974 [Linderina pennispora]